MNTLTAKDVEPGFGRLPELGDLVQVRSRRWLVEEVVVPDATGQSPIVRLARADDDAQGQSLEVFWATAGS